MLKPICARTKQQHWNPELRQILLRSEFTINGDKCVEFLLGEREQIAILNAGPAVERYSRNLVIDQIARESSIDTLVEQDLHSTAAASMRSLASSRNAM